MLITDERRSHNGTAWHASIATMSIDRLSAGIVHEIFMGQRMACPVKIWQAQ